MRDRTVTCTNEDGFSIVFGENDFSPFLLVECDGAYTVKNKVTLSENRMIDGATYQGSVVSYRNIVLTVKDRLEHVYNRNLISRLFKGGELGELVFSEGENKRKTTYYVESIESTGENGARTYTVSLICPDPFFYAIENMSVRMSSWIKTFKFVHEFTAHNEEFGYRSLEKLQNIQNENAADNIGMTITIKANGSVTNPTITRVESDTHITVGSESKPLNMVAGDTVVITTDTGNKHVYLIRDGLTTEINEYLTEESEFIQLMRGANSIGYSADAGVSNIEVTITYRMKYASA